MFKLRNAVSVILNGVYGVKNLWMLARKKPYLCIQIFRFAQQLVFVLLSSECQEMIYNTLTDKCFDFDTNDELH